MKFESLNGESVSFTQKFINANTLWIILALIFFLFAIFSIILVYHWHKFGMKAVPIATAEIIYFAVSGALILGAIASILLF